jgi:hypothetical protein
MIETGTRVIFSQGHYLWMQQANVWPNKYLSRREHWGTVIASTTGGSVNAPVRVRWDFTDREMWHFVDNLAVLELP